MTKPKAVGSKPLASEVPAKKRTTSVKPPEPIEVDSKIEAANSRDALIGSASEAHSLPVSSDGSTLPCPIFALDIEGMDVLASAVINSVSCVYFDASRASANELGQAVADHAHQNWLDREGRDSEMDDSAHAGSSLPDSVSVRSWILDIDAQLRRYNRTVAPSTQAWWLGASSLAQAAASAPRGAYRLPLGDTLSNIRSFIQHRLAECVCGLNLEDAQSVMNSVRFLVRGGQYDAAALETLFHQVLGIRPAVSAVTAFSDVDDPDTCVTNQTLWFYRSVTDIRAYLDGFHSGLLVASGNREGAKVHEDGLYKHAKNRARASSDRLAAHLTNGANSVTPLGNLRSLQTALDVKASAGRHVGEFDVLYDALLLLPTLNGTAARQFAESVLGNTDE